MKDSETGGHMPDLTVNKYGEFDECHCGNSPDTDGFHPCNDEGVNVEPDATWGDLWSLNKCDRCGAIYDLEGKAFNKYPNMIIPRCDPLPVSGYAERKWNFQANDDSERDG